MKCTRAVRAAHAARSASSWQWTGFVLVGAALWGCTSPATPADSGGLTDAATDTVTPADGPVDAAPCTRNADCDDGRYCTGVERCLPGDPAADARGCAPAAMLPCRATETCVESMSRCLGVDDAGTGCDEDGDGHRAVWCGGDDCDDADRQRYPGNPERCDGDLANGMSAAAHDEDCNPCTVAGFAPDGDHDNDRYPSASCQNPWLDTTAPVGCDLYQVRVLGPTDMPARVVRGGDCNDDATHGGADVHPNQPELCNGGVDDNCDGVVDQGTFWPDVDNDGRGDSSATPRTGACMTGWVANSDDCDDRRAETYRGTRELCDRRDNDCSLAGALAGGEDLAEDSDRDSHSPLGATCLGRGEPGAPGSAFPRDDCNDGNPLIHTGAIEDCSTPADDDCDGTTTNASTRVCDDRDGDGRGDPLTAHVVLSCALPAGTVLDTPTTCNDCNDRAAWVYPGAPELCDGVYENCDMGRGPAASEDRDGDGHAPIGTSLCSSTGPAGVATFPRDDCDDNNRAAHPGAIELCDGVDTDCNPATDEIGQRADCSGGRYCGVGGNCALPLLVPGGLPSNNYVAHSFATGGGHSCAISFVDGLLRCWGANSNGQLGTSMSSTTPSLVPQVVLTASAMDHVVAGASHTCAQLAGTDNSVYCWGQGTYGQNGDNLTVDRNVPVLAVAETSTVALISHSLTVGASHSCVAVPNATALCWGRNNTGQIGDNSIVNRTNQTSVTFASGLSNPSAGAGHTCALAGLNGIYCWGTNTYGQLGINTTTEQHLPTQLVLPGSTTPLVGLPIAGGDHTCGSIALRGVYCWGRDDNGQVGDAAAPGAAPRLQPTPIAGSLAPASNNSGGAFMAAGNSHTCLVAADGSLYCWGLNTNGQLGDGTTTSRSTPTRVPGLTSVTSVSAGANHTCARRSDATLWCWGRNDTGQLGDGTTTERHAPQIVLDQ